MFPMVHVHGKVLFSTVVCSHTRLCHCLNPPPAHAPSPLFTLHPADTRQAPFSVVVRSLTCLYLVTLNPARRYTASIILNALRVLAILEREMLLLGELQRRLKVGRGNTSQGRAGYAAHPQSLWAQWQLQE